MGLEITSVIINRFKMAAYSFCDLFLSKNHEGWFPHDTLWVKRISLIWTNFPFLGLKLANDPDWILQKQITAKPCHTKIMGFFIHIIVHKQEAHDCQITRIWRCFYYWVVTSTLFACMRHTRSYKFGTRLLYFPRSSLSGLLASFRLTILILENDLKFQAKFRASSWVRKCRWQLCSLGGGWSRETCIYCTIRPYRKILRG